jgi:AcrR family transcriptional regulator
MRSNEKRSVKKLMADAFVELLSEKDYIDITVTDVVNKAQVARVSFYRNFNSVSDIIDFITDSVGSWSPINILRSATINFLIILTIVAI